MGSSFLDVTPDEFKKSTPSEGRQRTAVATRRTKKGAFRRRSRERSGVSIVDVNSRSRLGMWSCFFTNVASYVKQQVCGRVVGGRVVSTGYHRYIPTSRTALSYVLK
ncbi:hypothetical protein GWI33_013332 [Rhynchophorus ferrugineus]|uniref:Uncharacterized protein n=1 Tax=Rhynchophorus ferrugineus TaxID=354439 RepID=A0A834I9G5_RHYFE|nr:hypothetical protein GWI33_013332 [Rhynchophorus ferrugineus]